MITAPRGVRDNNPGNIDFDLQAPPWQGEIRPSADPRFAQFNTMTNGVRALAKELLTYHNVHHLNTVRQIINRWAPPVENNTSAYVTDVATACGVHPDDLYNFNLAGLESLCAAIIAHENGSPDGGSWVSDADIAAGVAAAL